MYKKKMYTMYMYNISSIKKWEAIVN